MSRGRLTGTRAEKGLPNAARHRFTIQACLSGLRNPWSWPSLFLRRRSLSLRAGRRNRERKARIALRTRSKLLALYHMRLRVQQWGRGASGSKIAAEVKPIHSACRRRKLQLRAAGEDVERNLQEKDVESPTKPTKPVGERLLVVALLSSLLLSLLSLLLVQQ